jgi:hypothetical protein
MSGRSRAGRVYSDKYASIALALRQMQAAGVQKFSAQELSKKINDTAQSTSLYLRFTTGISYSRYEGYKFTGDPIVVMR